MRRSIHRNIAALVIEMARRHIADALGVLVTSGGTRSARTPSTLSGAVGHGEKIFGNSCPSQSPMRGLGQFAKVVADCGPVVPLGTIGAVGGVREDFAVILAKSATMGGNAKHQLPIA
jgi:hypothetical protein